MTLLAAPAFSFSSLPLPSIPSELQSGIVNFKAWDIFLVHRQISAKHTVNPPILL